MNTATLVGKHGHSLPCGCIGDFRAWTVVWEKGRNENESREFCGTADCPVWRSSVGYEYMGWEIRYGSDRIAMVYFVPSDREPLEDWRQRIDYYGHRLEQFHARGSEGPRLTTRIHPKPLFQDCRPGN